MNLKLTHSAAIAACFIVLCTGQAAAMQKVNEATEIVGRVVDSVEYAPTQSDGMTLSQAVQSVRRRGDVERVIDAKTEVRNGREMHYIRVMTKDGKVKTHTIPGRRRE